MAKALNKLGVPSAKDVDALIARIDELNKSVQKLSAKAAPSVKTATPRTAAPKKAPAKVVDEAAKPVVNRAAARKKVVATPVEAAAE